MVKAEFSCLRSRLPMPAGRAGIAVHVSPCSPRFAHAPIVLGCGASNAPSSGAYFRALWVGNCSVFASSSYTVRLF